MDLIFEFILDLLIDGGIEISCNKKFSKWIRYPISAIIILFFTVIIFGILYLGIILFKENILASLIMILIGLIMLVGSIIKFRKVYLKQKSNR